MSANKGYLPWSAGLAEEGKRLQLELVKAANHKRLDAAFYRESFSRFSDAMHGIQVFQNASFRGHELSAPAIWKEGSARLLDYGAEPRTAASDSPALLFIPSLINRSYIFDISPQRSMLGFFAARGFRCFLLDWGEPQEEEKKFGLEEYITVYLTSALRAAAEKAGTRPVLVGYCMGGLMALALGQLRPELTKGLALLATPWDFHAPGVPRLPEPERLSDSLKELFSSADSVPGQIIHWLLFMLNPFSALRRYERFSSWEADSEEAKSFLEREHWLYDNVNLTASVAKECFIEWGINNTPGKMRWNIGGETIHPGRIKLPAFVAMPRFDGIVPTACADPLASLIPGAASIRPATGHLGMVAGPQAADHLWKPLMKWLTS